MLEAKMGQEMAVKKAISDVSGWVAGIERAGRAEKNPHRKAILANYLQHVALEFNGRWEEFLGPDMCIDEPVYKSRLGTAEIQLADGYAAVLGFYHALNEDTVLTNHDERLAVADWGFVSYNTFNMWTSGRHLKTLGLSVPNANAAGYYRISRPIVMIWNYTSDAKLIGEEVYEVVPPRIDEIPAAEMPTWEEVRDTVKSYLPATPLRRKQPKLEKAG